MFRWVLVFTAVLVFATSANASLHTFATTGPTVPQALTVLDGDFELSDTPNGSGFQYEVVGGDTMTIQSLDANGLFTADLLWGQTSNGSVVLGFNDGTGSGVTMHMQFFDGTVSQGDPFPSLVSGNGFWSAQNRPSSVLPGNWVWGRTPATITAVPEPSAWGFGAMVVGLVGVGRFVRRRFGTTA
jgi:hypothetical protein